MPLQFLTIDDLRSQLLPGQVAELLGDGYPVYQPTLVYATGDNVQAVNNGQPYVAIANVPANTPPPNPSYWMPVSQRIELAERFAIADIIGILAVRYKIEEAFAQTGNNRSDWLLDITISLVIMRLFEALTPTHSADSTLAMRYKTAIRRLQEAASGHSSPPGLEPIRDADGKDIGGTMQFITRDRGSYNL
jgi:hypothetical protein